MRLTEPLRWFITVYDEIVTASQVIWNLDACIGANSVPASAPGGHIPSEWGRPILTKVEAGQAEGA